MEYKILGKRILLKVKEPEKTTASGIVLTGVEKNENEFTVIDVGSEVTTVKVGNTVIVGAHYGDTVKVDGKEYRIVTEESILLLK